MAIDASLILSIIGTVFGGGGIVSMFMYYRQNKRIKEMEALQAKYDTDKTLIENTSKLIDEWQDAFKRVETERDRFLDIINTKNEALSTLHQTIYKQQEELQQCKLDFQNATYYECKQRCKFRIPPREIDSECEPIKE